MTIVVLHGHVTTDFMFVHMDENTLQRVDQAAAPGEVWVRR
jgi:hypothetical protein